MKTANINPRFLFGLNQSADEVIEPMSTDSADPAPAKSEAPWIRQQPAGGEPTDGEILRLQNDGAGFDLSPRDVSDPGFVSENLRKAHTEFARLSRMSILRELTATIAHEINQPIGAMVTNGHAAKRWLTKQPANIQEAEEALECIIRDGHRAAEVVRKMRDLLATGSPQMIPVDITQVIREVLVLTSLEINQQKITVVTDLGTQPQWVIGDCAQLQQVLFNLITNSIDAMTSITGRPRTLQIRSSIQDDSLVIQVLDCGCGLPNATDSIFDPFFTTKHDAIGLGLTICRSIVESHGGRLWAENRSPHGAIVSFALPTETRAG